MQAVSIVVIEEELYDLLTEADRLLDELLTFPPKGAEPAAKRVYDQLRIISRKLTLYRERNPG